MYLPQVKHFILDECDRLLAELDMRRDVQTIFMATPHEKQVRAPLPLLSFSFALFSLTAYYYCYCLVKTVRS